MAEGMGSGLSAPERCCQQSLPVMFPGSARVGSPPTPCQTLPPFTMQEQRQCLPWARGGRMRPYMRDLALAMSPPSLLPSPSLLAFGGEGAVGETDLMLWEQCRAVAKTVVCPQHLPSCKYKVQHHEGCYGERSLHPSQTQFNLHPVFHTIHIMLRSYVI